MAFADYFPLPASMLPRALRPAAPRYFMPDGKPMHGMLAEFDTPADVYHASEKVRDAGFKTWDMYSPFPMHGAEDAMGFKRTILPVIVGCVGLTGAALGFLMQWWMSRADFPLVVQGKPPGAWEPFVPITFELGVLSAAFASLLSMFALNGLPRFHHPLFKHEPFLSSSDDKFFIYIEASDPKFNPDSIRQIYQQAGARRIDEISED